MPVFWNDHLSKQNASYEWREVRAGNEAIKVHPGAHQQWTSGEPAAKNSSVAFVRYHELSALWEQR